MPFLNKNQYYFNKNKIFVFRNVNKARIFKMESFLSRALAMPFTESSKERQIIVNLKIISCSEPVNNICVPCIVIRLSIEIHLK